MINTNNTQGDFKTYNNEFILSITCRDFYPLSTTHLLLVFALSPQPGLDALPRLDERLSLGLLLWPVGVDASEIGQE